jgi:hypothetical protein
MFVGGLECRENLRKKACNCPFRVHDPTIAIQDPKMLHKDPKLKAHSWSPRRVRMSQSRGCKQEIGRAVTLLLSQELV